MSLSIINKKVFHQHITLGSVKKVVSAVAKNRKEKRKNKRVEDARKFDSFDVNVIERTVHRLQKERKFVSYYALIVTFDYCCC